MNGNKIIRLDVIRKRKDDELEATDQLVALYDKELAKDEPGSLHIYPLDDGSVKIEGIVPADMNVKQFILESIPENFFD